MGQILKCYCPVYSIISNNQLQCNEEWDLGVHVVFLKPYFLEPRNTGKQHTFCWQRKKDTVLQVLMHSSDTNNGMNFKQKIHKYPKESQLTCQFFY